MQPAAKGKRVVVIGGGAAGFAIASKLGKKAEVTVIERNASFHFPVAAVRSCVDENFRWQQFMPYNPKAPCTVVQGEAIGLANNEVLLKDKDPVPFDFAVIATGSSMPFPGKPAPFTDVKAAEAQYAEIGERIKAASKVVVVGGGAVGLELAGEIVGAYKDKSVTLVSSGKLLARADPAYPDAFVDKVESALTELGVTCRLGERVEGEIPAQRWAENVTVKTDKGEYPADLVIYCLGGKPNTEMFKEFLGDNLDAHGFVKVNGHLQVEGVDHVFAVGDVAATREPKMVLTASQHVPVVVKNILALMGGKAPSAVHKPNAEPSVFLPLGPRKGMAYVGFAPFPLKGTHTRGLFANMKNSMRLFVDKQYKEVSGGPVPKAKWF